MKGFFNKNKSNNFADNRTYIEGELAIKPYYYFRNRHLHIRYNVDRAIELSEDEALKLKNDITENPSYKQSILAKAWSFFEKTVGKPIIHDGLREIEKKGIFNNGR